MFCDISKAFDRVWHRGLLCKLKAAGDIGTALKWFQSYISNCKQRVLLPGVLSDWQNIKAGVPQGSILGPLLFLVFINDIVSDINSNIGLFADDTTLYIIVENPLTAAIFLTLICRNVVSKIYSIKIRIIHSSKKIRETVSSPNIHGKYTNRRSQHT